MGCRADRLPPGAIVEIPVDRLRQSRRETFPGAPAELPLDPGRIDRIAPVVAGTVVDEGDQGAPRDAVGARRPGVDGVADRFDDLEVRPFRAAADNIALARRAAGQDKLERADMVLDEQPVADMLAPAVDRQLPAFEGIQ